MGAPLFFGGSSLEEAFFFVAFVNFVDFCFQKTKATAGGVALAAFVRGGSGSIARVTPSFLCSLKVSSCSSHFAISARNGMVSYAAPTKSPRAFESESYRVTRASMIV